MPARTDHAHWDFPFFFFFFFFFFLFFFLRLVFRMGVMSCFAKKGRVGVSPRGRGAEWAWCGAGVMRPRSPTPALTPWSPDGIVGEMHLCPLSLPSLLPPGPFSIILGPYPLCLRTVPLFPHSPNLHPNPKPQP